MRQHRRTFAVLCAAVPATLLASMGAAGAASSTTGPRGLAHRSASVSPSLSSGADEGGGGGETAQLMDRAGQYAAVRTAPGTTVSSGAFRAAQAQAAALPQGARAWTELTNQPYDSDAHGYRDPFWSNGGGGSGLVSGRMTSLAVDGGTVFAGAADGGVWRSTDKGAHWTPVFDQQASLAVGALSIDPADHSVWVGTGEANSSFEGYSGGGIYRSADGGDHWALVGDALDNSLISRLTFDGQGNVYAASSRGLLRRHTDDLTGAWNVVLKPDPNAVGSPYRTSWISDVKVRPGTQGKEVVAVLGWRGGTMPQDASYNGFYVSHQNGTGGTFVKVTPKGITGTIGRTSLDYAPDGALLAVIEDPATVHLKGVYRSPNGYAGGAWTLVADNDTLTHAPGGNTADAGDQAWYDQYVTADPTDAQHFYVGLKEVYETSDGGASFTTIGPYWNFLLPCYSADPAKDTCPATTHPDQHAALVAADGTAYFANDGGVYSRPASLRNTVQWTNLNATLHSLQYYYAGIGAMPSGGDAVYGGAQDNGTTLLLPGAKKMVSPDGGDGAGIIVDPKNGNRAVNSYVYLTMARTQNGGRSDGTTRSYTTITPTCAALIGIEFDPQPCDPNPRFIAPYVADQKNTEHWVAGGQFVWDNGGKGWSTVCNSDTCDWKQAHDLGAGAQTTSLGVSGATTYAGWCGNGCNPGGSKPFVAGIDTNYGGTWHRVSSPVLPNRIPTSFAVDPTDASHVYVVYGAFSRRWIPGGGVGHVFESTDGGTTWSDRSGDLPDAPANDIVLKGGRLIVATDVGVFASPAGGTSWSRLGAGLPAASAADLVLSPDKSYLVAATHGRGMWRYELN